LLLADPKAQRDRDRQLKLAFERAGSGDVNEIINLGRYDPAKVFVYRRNDLVRAKCDLEDAEFVMALLTVYLDRKIRRDASETDLEGQRVAGLREGMFRLFSEKRLFREALDRIRRDRQSGA
jgi:hypothetical protein